MVFASNLGYPRIGPKRELKTALERYWSGQMDASELEKTAGSIRKDNWTLQHQLGLNHIPSNDFSLYDHVLDTAALFGCVPERYGWNADNVDLKTYFAMARGRQDGSVDVPAMDMTKWFDTNYHYIVPEFEPNQKFRVASSKPVEEFREAKSLGIHTRPVLLGPVSFLLLGKSRQRDLDRLTLLDRLLPVYEELFQQLSEAGADWVQMDEPFLVLDLDTQSRTAFQKTYQRLSQLSSQLRVMLATYFGDLEENLPLALQLPVSAIHLDLVRGPDQLQRALQQVPQKTSLSLGIVDGRNVWRTNLRQKLELLKQAVSTLGSDRVWLAPSCSLLHCPVDLKLETQMDPELRQWLAFAKQKAEELVVLARALNEGEKAVSQELQANDEAMRSKRSSDKIHNKTVKDRVAGIRDEMARRKSPYAARKSRQRERLRLPVFPTTTIGSFPQTAEVRHVRAEYKSGKRDLKSYEQFLREEIERTVRFQEEIGLDVLVHGEFERTDMVEYFGERFTGVAFTQNGWVQSYGSRCVRPPIIYGDVSRPEAMTVRWSQYAQSLTARPVKGMLTGPVTILQWSFVRDDQPRSETSRQIALAIRDEVIDLEKAGIRIIQIDEPALREGLPLRRKQWQDYLKWAVQSFRLASSGVADETQIHSHMCYSEFNDILEAIAEMDADVIAIEASRSQMELLGAFHRYHYPSEIGPGVYDIHSPRIPKNEEMEALLRKALEVLNPDQLWVNPDCGLKTRKWEEVKPALSNMVEVARQLRSTVT
jgi:5-methyltetrahydropteroyltriglutamate--homocysteine methyltransferase